MFAITVAVQMIAKAGDRNGLKGDPTFAEEEDSVALIFRSAALPACALFGN
jgi:hypothetical protein